MIIYLIVINLINGIYTENTDKVFKYLTKSYGYLNLPLEFFWGDVEGYNFLTSILDQNKPNMCNSCWAHVIATTITEKHNINNLVNNRNNINKNNIMSPQYLLNYAGTGTCKGGTIYHTLIFLLYTKNIIPCTKQLPYTGNVNNITNKKYFLDIYTFSKNPISNFGIINNGNINILKKEIYYKGPIICSINGIPLLKYEKGIIKTSNYHNKYILNHVVSIVGWGKYNKTEYWIIKNSWGYDWGENGYARIKVGENIYGIESECYWIAI